MIKTIFTYFLVFTLTLATPVTTFGELANDGNSIYVVDEEENPDDDAGWVESLTLAAVVIPAPTLALKCREKISVMGYLATSLYYVGGEIFDWSTYTEGADEAMKIVADSDKDKQVQAINAAYEETNEAAKAEEAKADRALYASVGFGVSALAAMYESSSADGGKCAKVKGKGKTDVPVDTGASAVKSYKKGDIETPVTPEVEKSKTEPVKTNDKKKGDGKDKVKKKGETGQLNSEEIMITLINYFFPTVEAKTKAAQMGIVAGVAGAFATLWAPVQKFMAQSLESGTSRAILFGALATLSYTVSKKHESIADSLKTRAKQYKELADSMDETLTTAKDLGGDGITSMAVPIVTNSNSLQVDNIAEERAAVNCVVGTDGAAAADPNCDCAQTNTCKISEFSNMSLGDLGKTGVMSTATTDLGLAGSAGYSSGTYDGTTFDSSKFGNYASKIDGEIAGLEKKINKSKLSKTNKINYDKGRKLAAAKLKSIMKKGIKRLSPVQLKKLNDSFPKMGPTPAAVSNSDKEGKGRAAYQENSNPKLEAKKGGVQIPGFEFNYKKKKFGRSKSASKAKDKNYMKHKYKFKTDDVSKRKNTALFKIITTRYMKSAYPILLERDAL